MYKMADMFVDPAHKAEQSVLVSFGVSACQNTLVRTVQLYGLDPCIIICKI
jgi:hypothetical protein